MALDLISHYEYRQRFAERSRKKPITSTVIKIVPYRMGVRFSQ